MPAAPHATSCLPRLLVSAPTGLSFCYVTTLTVTLNWPDVATNHPLILTSSWVLYSFCLCCFGFVVSISGVVLPTRWWKLGYCFENQSAVLKGKQVCSTTDVQLSSTGPRRSCSVYVSDFLPLVFLFCPRLLQATCFWSQRASHAAFVIKVYNWCTATDFMWIQPATELQWIIGLPKQRMTKKGVFAWAAGSAV